MCAVAAEERYDILSRLVYRGSYPITAVKREIRNLSHYLLKGAL